MSVSKLGPLPDVSGRGGRGLTGRPRLDEDVLGSLLDSHEKTNPAAKKHRHKATRTRGSEGVKSYSQLATLAAEEEEEEEEEDVSVTEEETKKLADTVDIDDMDASLFGSFSRGKKAEGRPPGSRSSAAKSVPGGKKMEKSGLLQEIPPPEGTEPLRPSVVTETTVGVPPGGRRRDVGKSQNAARSGNISLKEEKTKGLKSELDDDLLDLLSDSDHEDVGPKKRAKPTIQLKTSRTSTKPESGSSNLGGKPITSEGGIDNGGGMVDREGPGELDRPKTSRGKSALEKLEELQNGGDGESKEKGGADVLRLDSPPEQHSAAPSITTTPVRTHSRPAVDSGSSFKIDFGEDEDDLLSGMGLDDNGTSSKTKNSGIFGTKRGSKVDELFGITRRKPSGRQLTKTAERKAENTKQPQRGAAKIGGGGEDEKEEEEEEGYQFGGYLPSVALGSDSRRRHSSEESLTSRPNSAPAKKSVRFADTVDVETSDRPSSSPAVTDPPKPSLKGGRKGGTVGRQREVDEASRKPPLPRKMDAAEQPVTQEEMVTEQQEDEMTSGGNGEVGESKPTAGEFLSSDSLFPLDESASKSRSSVRGRRGSEKSSVAKLFDDNLNQDVQEGGGGGGGGGGGREGGGGGFQNEGAVSTSGDSGGPHMEEDLSPKSVSADEKLEHPLFPWQTKKQSHLSASRRQVDMPGLGTVVESSAAPGDKGNLVHTTTVPTRRQYELSVREAVDFSSSVSFQEQLLQQQKQLQEQVMKLQLQGGGGYSSEGALKNRGGRGEERLGEEWKAVQKRVKEMEALLEREKADNSEKQRKIIELQQELQVCEEGRGRVEEECRALQGKVADLEREHQAARLELNSQVDELKLKLHRAELERDQARQLLEEGKARHSEELKAVQSANEARLKDMEESFQRRESRWREDMEAEASRFQERLQEVERERVDAVTALKRKVDLVEVAKTNEISRLQEIHRAAVVDLKNEHELDKQHMQSLHRQEVEALKAAHSHTRLLSELTHQVEASSREVSQLQQRVDHAHSRGAEEREQGVRAQEEHLKMLEDRLSRQQAENEVERERLQSLIAKLEAHVVQQSRQIEQERWQLRQEGLRLKTQQTAFEEEKMASLRRVEEEKDHLQQTKENFLSEQQEVLSQCYEERRSLATERAELSVLQKRALEREQRETQKSLQVEAEMETSLSRLREESTRIAMESARVREEGERVKWEKEALERDKEKLEVFGREIQHRSQEVEEMCKSAIEVRDQGERSLLEARTLQLELSEQSRTMERELMELREREKHFAAEQLALAQQRREVQHLTVVTRSNQEELQPLGRTGDEMVNTWSGGTDTIYDPVHPPSLPPLHTHPTITTTSYAPPPQSGKGYSPWASPVHLPFHSSSSTKSSLAQLQHSRNMREMALLAEKDREDLKEECEFLESLQKSLL